MNVGEIISEHKTSKGGSWPGAHILEQCTRVSQQDVCCTQRVFGTGSYEMFIGKRRAPMCPSLHPQCCQGDLAELQCGSQGMEER